MPIDPQRRADLVGAKLRALVRERWGEGDRHPATFPGGSALLEDGRGWVLSEENSARSLGPALVWASRLGALELHLIVEDPEGSARPVAGGLARRAREFVSAPTVWAVKGGMLVEVDPEPVPVSPPLPPAAVAFADVLLRAGAEPVVEHGVLRGEVLGLEVARVVVDDAGAYLEVGVGKHDREAQRLVHGDVPTPEALARAVRAVAARRLPRAELHPLNRLARERWLRSALVASPELVGAAHLAPVPSPVILDDLRKPAPAPAAGEDLVGHPLLVVCSVGIDLDLVPAAADARLADGRHPRLILVMPKRDDHPVTRQLASALIEPAEVQPVDAVEFPGT